MFREIRDRIEVMSDRDHLSERQSIDHEEAKHLISNAQLSESSFEIHNDDSVNVGKIIGTWMNKDLLRLKQLIFRATRGNALIINKNEDKVRGFNKNVFAKSVFIIIFQEGSSLRK